MPLYQVQQPPRESVINQIGALIQGIQQGQELARKRQIEAQMLPLQKALLEAQAGYYNQRGEGQQSGSDMMNMLMIKYLMSLPEDQRNELLKKKIAGNPLVQIGPADNLNQALGFASQGKPGTAQAQLPSKPTPSISSLMPVISAMTGGTAPIAQRAAKFFEIAKQQGKEGQYTESGMTLKEKQPIPATDNDALNAAIEAMANIKYIEDQGLGYLSGQEQFVRNTGTPRYSKTAYQAGGGEKGMNADKAFKAIRNAALKAQGGKALTPMEMKTALEAMPDPLSYDENFATQWKAYKNRVAGNLAAWITKLDSQGYKIPDVQKSIDQYYQSVSGGKTISAPTWNAPDWMKDLGTATWDGSRESWNYLSTDGNWYAVKKDGTIVQLKVKK